MERRQLTKEDIDKVRNIEGFPIGTDEDIIALSDAPYYTACPNPFIEEFIRENGTPYDEATDDYHREPFSSDVSEGKNDPFYNIHSYHTKVPYKAIMRYILHYTKPGDIVFDGFCGSGMTGLACQACGAPDYALKAQIESEMKDVSWGVRYGVLNDLSPIATFISRNYNRSYNSELFRKKAEKALQDSRAKYEWMYKTKHVEKTPTLFSIAENGDEQYGIIDKVIWSDSLICPHCGEEFVFWKVAVAKFSQNEDLKQKLLETGNAFLVECARTDKVWACGRRLDDDRRFDAAKWDGKNILGFALMEVRSMLRQHNSEIR